MEAKKIIVSLFTNAGIRINGDNPWDPQVHNDIVFSRWLAGGSLALGETYMEGLWDCDQIDGFIEKLLRGEIQNHVPLSFKLAWTFLLAKAKDLNSRENSHIVGEKHYDIGNDLYAAMLDNRMVYTCGYWQNAQTLDEAQEAKLDLICRKLEMKPGQTVLDIGCGFGSFAQFAAEKYGVHVVGITISKEQVVLAKERCKGLPVEIRLQDYRDIPKGEQFDCIVSVGMFEHVGLKYYREYMEIAARCLKDGGLFMLHTIGRKKSIRSSDPWSNKYIFPGGRLPSLSEIDEAVDGLFILEDVHNFGPDYSKTLLAWHANFIKGWPQLQVHYGEPFKRMWEYYLLSFAGSFRARDIHLWQIVLSKGDLAETYRSIR
jgi:cyclopropane-fatty-acyl-phospholipid synthase